MTAIQDARAPRTQNRLGCNPRLRAADGEYQSRQNGERGDRVSNSHFGTASHFPRKVETRTGKPTAETESDYRVTRTRFAGEKSNEWTNEDVMVICDDVMSTVFCFSSCILMIWFRPAFR